MLVDFSKCKAQTQAHRALKPGNTITLAFGRGVGKSTVQRIFWYLLVAQWDGCYRPGSAEKGVRIVMLMPTLRQANRTHSSKYFGELARNGPWSGLGAIVNKTTMQATFPGGSWIQWVSADNANDNRGIRCDVVSIDEADDIEADIYHAIVLPWLSEPHSLKIRIISGTPRRGRYGLLWTSFRKLPEKYPDRCFGFHATAYDAPLLVDPAIVAEAKETTPPATFAREWMCDFDAAEGLVYPMFQHDLHVVEAPVKFNRVLVGIDHGWEDPAVFLVIGVIGSGRDASAYAIYEYYESHKTIDELADVAAMINEAWPGAEWYADSARPENIAAFKKRIGRRIKSATHKIEDGVDTVATMLSPRIDNGGNRVPHLFVTEDCPNLIEEMGKYKRKRDPKNQDRILDDILDKDNHAQDSLRYPIFHAFGKVYSSKKVLEDHNDFDDYDD